MAFERVLYGPCFHVPAFDIVVNPSGKQSLPHLAETYTCHRVLVEKLVGDLLGPRIPYLHIAVITGTRQEIQQSLWSTDAVNNMSMRSILLH